MADFSDPQYSNGVTKDMYIRLSSADIHCWSVCDIFSASR